MSYLPTHRSTHQAYTPLESTAVRLIIRQHPRHALVTNENKEKGRKPLDPPPIVQLIVDATHDPNDYWLVNPFLFMMAMVIDAKTEELIGGNNVLGQNVSSLHRLKDLDTKDGGFFVFGDISCRRIGTYKLQFNLYDYDKSSGNVLLVDSTTSKEFKVVSAKEFKGLAESTNLSRHFSDQGVRLRLRKEPRSLTGTKRAWNTSPTQPSTPGGYSSMYTNCPMHTQQTYSGLPPAKRQRTSDDYSSSSYLFPPFQPRPPTGSYAADAGYGTNNLTTWSSQETKGYSNDQLHTSTSNITGMMTPLQNQSLWPRNFANCGGSTLGSSTAVASSTAGGYFSGAVGTGVSTHYNNSGSLSAPFRGSVSSAAAYLSGQPYLATSSNALAQYSNSSLRPSSTSAEGYPALSGLHTPTSLSDQSLSGGGSGGSASGGGLGGGTTSYAQTQQQQQQQQPDLRSPALITNYPNRGLTLDVAIPAVPTQLPDSGGCGSGGASGDSQPEYLF